jgi:polysaccharide export outer membrane protein
MLIFMLPLNFINIILSWFKTSRLQAMGLILFFCTGLMGCTIPSSFFRPSAVDGPGRVVPFTLQDLTQDIVLGWGPKIDLSELPAALRDAEPVSFDKIDVDDRISVIVFEPNTSARSVLGGVGGKTDLLVNVPVDAAGMLNVPFAGVVKAQGLTLEQLNQKLLSQLRRVVLDPQLQVFVQERASKLVTVQGLAGKSGRYALDRRMQRLSHVLAQVAPDQKNPEMLQVAVRRGDIVGRMRLADVYEDLRLDIPLHADDSIVIREVIHNVSVLGAVNQQGPHRIPRRQFSVLDAIALAGGMNEERADPSAVFLFRQSELEESQRSNRLPVIYRLDLGRPEVMLIAKRTLVSDNDVILIGDASFTDVRKVSAALNAILGGARLIYQVSR